MIAAPFYKRRQIAGEAERHSGCLGSGEKHAGAWGEPDAEAPMAAAGDLRLRELRGSQAPLSGQSNISSGFASFGTRRLGRHPSVNSLLRW